MVAKITPKTNQLSGVLAIDKPAGPTSHDVVQRIRDALKTSPVATPAGRQRLTGLRQTGHGTPKVGHTGTLDPLATGLLLIVVGPATRLIEYSHAWDKEYQATFVLGASSSTDDAAGTIELKPPVRPPDQARVTKALQHFVGESIQHPPVYSAVKSHGKKLYQLARQGLSTAELQAMIGERARPITISDITLNEYRYPKLSLNITCGTGTYIRSLARDLGALLDTAAYVSQLRRLRIGKFEIKGALPLDKLSTDFLKRGLMSYTELICDLDHVEISPDNVAQFTNGQPIELPQTSQRKVATASNVSVWSTSGQCIGIGLVTPTTSLLSPKKIIF